MKSNLFSSAKITLLSGVALLALALLPTACSKEQKSGYTVSGVVVGGTSQDTIYIEEVNNGISKIINKVALTDSTFTLTGKQDSLAVYYLSCVTERDEFSTPIFLENANIKVRLEDFNESITGTEYNDAYQQVRGRINDVRYRMVTLDNDTTRTKEEKAPTAQAQDDEYDAIFLEGQYKNITNPVGIYLFKMKVYENTIADNQKLMKLIPEQYIEQDIELQGIKKMLERQEITGVDRPFTDLTLKTPEGHEVKLSDFVGKGKPVLVDFWASWCGPCRRSMPELVELYAKYKGKFELVGISLDENNQAWIDAIKQLGITWPQMSDLQGWKSIAATTYGVNLIPHTILINKDGMIVGRDLHGENLEENLINLF